MDPKRIKVKLEFSNAFRAQRNVESRTSFLPQRTKIKLREVKYQIQGENAGILTSQTPAVFMSVRQHYDLKTKGSL